MKLTTWLTPWPGLVGMHVSVSESEHSQKKDNMWGCPSFIKAIKTHLLLVIMYMIVY